MIVDKALWSREKEEAYKRLWEDLEIGYLDEDLLDILLEFFKRPESFTKSSCSGRITLLDGPLPWERKESTIIFKKHSTISLEEIGSLLQQQVVHRLWLVATGPIIHVITLTGREARRILGIAGRAGFKHSGIMSVSKKGFIVELRTGIRLAVLLKTRRGLVVTSEGIEEAVRAANEALVKGKERLKRLLLELRRSNTSSKVK